MDRRIKELRSEKANAVQTIRENKVDTEQKIRKGISEYGQDVINDAQKLIVPWRINAKHYALQLTGDVFRKMEWTSRLGISVIPNVDLTARIAIYIKGTHFYDMKWYVKSVTTTIGSGGVNMSANLISNALFQELIETDERFTQEFIAQTVAGHNFSNLRQDAAFLRRSDNKTINKIKKGEELGRAIIGTPGGIIKPPDNTTLNDYTYQTNVTREGKRQYTVQLANGDVETNKFIPNSKEETDYQLSLTSRGIYKNTNTTMTSQTSPSTLPYNSTK